MSADITLPRDAPHAKWCPSPFLRFSAGLHVAAAAWVLARPRDWRLAAGALALDHALLSTVGIYPRSRLLGPNHFRLPATAAARREIALTFDDGPDPQVTPHVLDLLDEAEVKASFFCIGARAEAEPDLLREIVRRGHRVENHTQNHPNTFALFGPRGMAREIDLAQEVLTRLSGRRPRSFRAPAGIRGPLLDPLLAARDLTLVSWTHRGYDAFERDPRRVLRRLTRGLGPGDVALLHDGGCARDSRGRPVVLEALPRFLDHLRAADLRAVPFALKDRSTEDL